MTYTPSSSLPYGTYKVTLIATDIAGNSTGPLSTFLTITTVTQITTLQEKEIIKQETQSLKPEEQKQVIQELEITKPSQDVPSRLPTSISPTQPNIQKTNSSPKSSFLNFIFSIFR